MYGNAIPHQHDFDILLVEKVGVKFSKRKTWLDMFLIINMVIRNSNTLRLYSQWLNSVIYYAINHWAEARDAIWRHSDIMLTLC